MTTRAAYVVSWMTQARNYSGLKRFMVGVGERGRVGKERCGQPSPDPGQSGTIDGGCQGFAEEAGARRAILSGMIAVGSFLVIGKLIAAAKEIVVASRFGVSDIVDAYQFSFTLTQWPATFLGAAMVSVIVPLFSTATQDDLHRKRIYSRLFGYVLFASVGIGCISLLAFPFIVSSGIFSFTAIQESRVVTMVTLLSLVIPAAIASRFLAGCTMAARSHVNTLFECLPALAILVFVGCVPLEQSLVLGGMTGIFVQCILLAGSVAILGTLVRPRLELPGEEEYRIFGAFGVFVLAYLLLGSVEIIDQIAAASLPPGSLATLGYANRVLALVLGIVATTICRSLLPVLSAYNGEGKQIRPRFVLVLLGMLISAAAVGAIAIAWFSGDIIRVLFERGAFGSSDTERVASALRWGVTRVPPYLMTIVLMYAITSQQRARPLLLLGLVTSVGKLTATLLLLPWLGFHGLLLSSTVAYCGAAGFALWIFLAGKQLRRRRLQFMPTG